MPKFIFITGGVLSSLGKGIAAASIGALLEAGGLTVTVLGLLALSGDARSLLVGWQKMVVANQAHFGVWREAVAHNAQHIARVDDYNRLSVIQPITHLTTPWPNLLVGFPIVVSNGIAATPGTNTCVLSAGAEQVRFHRVVVE